jgi:REP element-mobilizing transposase RayT
MKEREFNKLSHTIYECIYHVVFCPKYRKMILQDYIAEYIKGEQTLPMCQRLQHESY